MQMFPHPVPRPNAALPLIDNMFAPEIAVAGVAGMAVINGVVTITLESVRCDHSKPLPELERVVVGRIAASISAAQALMTGALRVPRPAWPQSADGTGGNLPVIHHRAPWSPAAEAAL